MKDMQIKDYKIIIDWYVKKVESQSREIETLKAGALCVYEEQKREIETLRARVKLIDRIMLEHNHSRDCSLHESAIEYLNQ